MERQGIRQGEIVTVEAAGHGLQQRRAVLADIGGLLAQAQALQGRGILVSVLFAHGIDGAMANVVANCEEFRCRIKSCLP